VVLGVLFQVAVGAGLGDAGDHLGPAVDELFELGFDAVFFFLGDEIHVRSFVGALRRGDRLS